MGLLVWNLFASLVIGLSFSALHAHFDELFHILELLGCFYIFYLAYTFYQISLQQLKPVQADKKTKEPSFFSALLMQTLNGKLYPVLSLMFSQFLDSHKNVYFEAIILSVLFFLLCLAVYLFYGMAGAKLNKALGQKGKARQMQISAILLALVGVWLLKGSVLFN